MSQVSEVWNIDKGSKTMYVRGVESGVCGFIQSNLTHVGGVKSA